MALRTIFERVLALGDEHRRRVAAHALQGRQELGDLAVALVSEPLSSFSCASSSARRASVVVRSPSLFLMSVAVSSRRTLRLSRSAVMACDVALQRLGALLDVLELALLGLERLLGFLGGLGCRRLAGLRLVRLRLGSLRQHRRTAARRPGPRRQTRRRAGTAVASQVSLASTSLFPPTQHARPYGN